MNCTVPFFILYSLVVDSVALKKAIKCENYLKSLIGDIVAQMHGKKLFALIDKCDDLPEIVQRGPCCAHLENSLGDFHIHNFAGIFSVSVHHVF